MTLRSMVGPEDWWGQSGRSCPAGPGYPPCSAHLITHPQEGLWSQVTLPATFRSISFVPIPASALLQDSMLVPGQCIPFGSSERVTTLTAWEACSALEELLTPLPAQQVRCSFAKGSHCASACLNDWL
jgi:hypothetical protein